MYDSSLINQLVNNVHDDYGMLRSFRRGPNTVAQNKGISATYFEKNNRWRKMETTKGNAILHGL